MKPYMMSVVYSGGVFGSSEPEISFNDIRLKWNDGNITVTAENSKVFYIRVQWKIDFSESALFLGDAFERSYGKLEWKNKEEAHRMPWYTLIDDGEKIHCFGVKTQPNSFCFWDYRNGILTLEADVRSGTRGLNLEGRTLEVCTVVSNVYEGSAFEAAKRFCKEMCDNPILPKHRIYGGNDWYCCYGNNSRDIILEHARRIAECAPKDAPLPYMVIDDGWQLCAKPNPVGPWQISNRMFGDMGKLASEMKEAGTVPGIWFRPLCTVERFPVDYYLNRDRESNCLDPSKPEVLSQIKNDVTCIKNWGFKLIKHDFSTRDILKRYSPEHFDDVCRGNVHFSTDKKTTAEVILDLYRTLREAAGNDVLLIGCDTVGHLGAGLFEIQRIGDDTSGKEFVRTVEMGVNTLAFRMAQEDTFFAIDADCVGITNMVPFEKNKKWLDLIAESGTALFVSIASDAYTDEVKEAIKEAFKKVLKADKYLEPIDWQETKTPTKWKRTDGTVVEYDWN